MQGEEGERGKNCLSPSSRRINRTACKFGGKSQFIHLRQSRRKEACSLGPPHFGSGGRTTGTWTMLQRGWRSAPTVKKARQPNLSVAASDLSVVLRSSASSLAPSIRRNRGRRRAGHFLAAVAVTAQRGREGETPLTKRKAKRAFIILRAILPIALLFLLGVMRGRHPDREFDKKDSSPLLLVLPSLYIALRTAAHSWPVALCQCEKLPLPSVCLLCFCFRTDGGALDGVDWTTGCQSW